MCQFNLSTAHQTGVNHITFSHDGLRIATSAVSGNLKVWTANRFEPVAEFTPAHSGETTCAAYASVMFAIEPGRLAVQGGARAMGGLSTSEVLLLTLTLIRNPNPNRLRGLVTSEGAGLDLERRFVSDLGHDCCDAPVRPGGHGEGPRGLCRGAACQNTPEPSRSPTPETGCQGGVPANPKRMLSKCMIPNLNP